MNMAILTMFQNTGVFKRDQVLLLDRDQLTTNLFGFLHFWETNHNQIAHQGVLNCLKLGDTNEGCQALRRLDRGKPLRAEGG
jgi:hypothetical protein